MQAGRYAAAQLKAVGLGDLIAATEDDYVSIASALARDVARRTALRQTLRARLAGSAICDARRLSRHLERIYRAIGR
jgi:predicted O-linked N-acetylglucosamine transferase (SPINDLY family)